MRLHRLTTIVLFGGMIWATPALASAGGEESSGAEMLGRMAMLAIGFGIILIAAKLGNLLFERLGLPGVLGELISGIAIGPYALGGLGFYGFAHGLIPFFEPSVISPELNGICIIASIVLMFTIGLETDLGALLRYSVAGITVGIGGIVLSMGTGCLFASGFAQVLFGRELSLMSTEALFIGLVSTATSVGITARILSEKRKLETPESVTILTAAVIDDVLGIVLLAVVVGMASFAGPQSGEGADWARIGMISIKAVGVWLVATVVGLALGRRISRTLKTFGRGSGTTVAIFAFAMALILAGLFEEAGLAMIVGAYVMGLSLSHSDIAHLVRERLHTISLVFVPVFFCCMGMMIDIRELVNPTALMYGVLFGAIAFFAKLIGCGGAAMLTGFNFRGAARVGVGMIPRGEVGLIIAGIGITLQILPASVFAVVMIMIIFNTIAAPPLLSKLFDHSGSGLRRERASSDTRRELSFTFPTEAITRFILEKITNVFSEEGFFVHCLDTDQDLYQLRKDSTMINLQQTKDTLYFICHEREMDFVNTAMRESLAETEQALHQLREPLDSAGVVSQMQVTAAPAKVSLREFLLPGLIVADLKADDKQGVIEELLDVMDRAGMLPDRDEATRSVWKREQAMSTGLEKGIAIPHGKSVTVGNLVCAVGIKRDGVDFESMDGKPAHFIFLTISPQDRPTPHLRFMSLVPQLLTEANQEQLLAAKDRNEVYQILCPTKA